MSRAQTVRLVLSIIGAIGGMLLFMELPFGTIIDAAVGVAAFVIVGGIGERYFHKHATSDEIRADLEARKDD